MGYLGEEIGKLGFGLMRLPKKEGSEEFDLDQIKQMVDAFLEAGFTYFDTAWAYPGSEDAIRQALVERYPRDRFQLATKNAAWINCKTREDAIAQFETSLKQTGAGYFDFYLLHNLGEQRTHFFDDFDLWSFVKEKKEEGLIRHIGFSFHSTPEELESSCASWAIRFAADLDGIITALSGMSSLEQMQDNLSCMKGFKGLSPDEKATLDKAREELAKIPLIPCTTCNYCAKVCPMDIGISGSFTAMNYLTLYNDLDRAKHQEDWLVAMHGRKKAAECIKCGACEQACPQHIRIRDELVKVAQTLG